MAMLDPVQQVDFLQKGDDVGVDSRDLRKELSDRANIEMSGSHALVECAVEWKVLDSDTAIAGMIIWRVFFTQQVRVGQAGVAHSDTPDDGMNE